MTTQIRYRLCTAVQPAGAANVRREPRSSSDHCSRFIVSPRPTAVWGVPLSPSTLLSWGRVVG